MKDLTSASNNKSSLFLLIFALIVGGVGAQASGILNTSEGGYLVCVDAKTKVVTHPGTSSCPKGSKKLVLGAQGATGITGAAGLPGKDGMNGKDGKTLWNGVKDPESTWGAPGDMFINSVTKTLFGPKNLDGTWPTGVSMVGPKGDQGPIGLTGATGAQGPIGGNGPIGPTGPTGATGSAGATGATGATGPAGTNATIAITELFICDGPDAGTVADEKCKIGMTGPGGGLIFFVDYFDQYADFNYLEAAPKSCEAQRRWSSTNTTVSAAAGWAARAVGAGSANTAAIKVVFTSDTSANNAALFADSLSCGTKTDWFLGSLWEMKLMYDNLQGLGEFVENDYWSSSQYDASNAWFLSFLNAGQDGSSKSSSNYVRPVRAF